MTPTDDLTKDCPRCHKSIKAAARICRYCAFSFDQASLDRTTAMSETKRCPMCAEEVRLEALLCRHCGYSFADGTLPEQRAAALVVAAPAAKPKRRSPLMLALRIILPLILIFGVFSYVGLQLDTAFKALPHKSPAHTAVPCVTVDPAAAAESPELTPACK